MPRGYGKPYTEEDVRRIRQLYKEGMTVKRIALELDRGVGSLLAKMGKLGLTDRRDKGKVRVSIMFSPEEVAKIDRAASRIGKTRSSYLRWVAQLALQNGL